MLKTEETILRKNISKLKTAEIFKVLSSWSSLTTEDVEHLRANIDGKQTKSSIASSIWELCKGKDGLCLTIVGELELLCVQIHSTKRQWNAYQLSSSKPGKAAAEFSSPQKFKQKLDKLIRLYFSKDCCTSVLLHDGLLWGRVYLPKPGSREYQASRCVYFVHYPHTPVAILSGMRAAFANFMTHCLVVALGYREMTEMSLTGHHVESIAELSINKLAEGGFTKFQQTFRPNGPLGLTTTRKRKACEPPLDSPVVDENRDNKRLRLSELANNFGDHEQPTLEKVEFRVELPYRSKTIAPELRSDGEAFHSRVRLRGKNVLEGIRNLAEHGYASLPLPKHLTCVPSRARNYFLLTTQRANASVQNNTSVSKDKMTPRKENQSPNQLDTSIQSAKRVSRRVSPRKDKQSPQKSKTSAQNKRNVTQVRTSPRKGNQLSKDEVRTSPRKGNQSSKDASRLKENRQNVSRTESPVRKTTRRSVSK